MIDQPSVHTPAMQTFRALRVIPALAPLLLGACAANSSYPSLDIRPAERINQTANPAADTAPPAPAPPPASADLNTRLADLVRYAQQADSQFQSLLPGVQRTIAQASGAAIASDRWSSAQIAFAQLDSASSGTISALADLDSLYAQARDKDPLTQTPSISAIVAARSQVLALAAKQDDVLASLSASLK